MPATLETMTGLEVLDVSRNALTELDDALCALRSLRVLRLAQNRLERLPRGLHRLRSRGGGGGGGALEELDLEGNPCEDPPTDVCVRHAVRAVTSFVEKAQYTEGTVTVFTFSLITRILIIIILVLVFLSDLI